MGFLAGKRALIVGVAGDRSIAWCIAKAMHREGAEIAYTYQNEKLKERVEKLAGQTKSDILIPCDVSSDEHVEGAEIAYPYQNEKLKERVEKLAAQTKSDILIPCDVSSDEQIEAVFSRLDDYWDGLDIIVHSVAFALREQLSGNFVDVTTRDGFRIAHEISSYSLTALAKAGRGMMQGRQGAMLTLSYIGGERSVPNYNVMGLAQASPAAK